MTGKKKMTMKKKIKIMLLILLVVITGVVFVLCYRAGVHITTMQMEKQKEQEQKEEALRVTPTPKIADQEETVIPTETPVMDENREYRYLKFSDNLSEFFGGSQIEQIESGVGDYLDQSENHANVLAITCTEYHMRSQTKNQVYGYLELDDGALLQYSYDFDADEVKIMETAVTLKNLEEKKQKDEDAEEARRLQEEEERKKEELAQEIFGYQEGGTPVQPTPTPGTEYQTQQSFGNTGTYHQSSQPNQTGSAASEEQIPEAPDYSEEIREEQIPEPVFTD